MSKLITSLIIFIICSSTHGAVNVKGTYWAKTSDAGGCQLPSTKYVVDNAIALGQATELGNLKWRPGLCGQVLKINCGHKDVMAVVASTCNLGSNSCGIDMIEKTWNTATNNARPGIAICTATLTNINPLSKSGPQCFHRPNSDIGNRYFAILGVLNTGGKLPSAAKIFNINGIRDNDGWFKFDAAGKALLTDNAIVTFYFEDGSKQYFTIGQCQKSFSTQIFQ